MKFLITIIDETGQRETYHAIGAMGALMDAAYDNGALGVSVRPA